MAIVYTHKIKGEPFIVGRIDANHIIITHESWSLTGYGETLIHAELDLLNEAKELSKEFIKIPVTELAPDALDLREFIYKII